MTTNFALSGQAAGRQARLHLVALVQRPDGSYRSDFDLPVHARASPARCPKSGVHFYKLSGKPGGAGDDLARQRSTRTGTGRGGEAVWCARVGGPARDDPTRRSQLAVEALAMSDRR